MLMSSEPLSKVMFVILFAPLNIYAGTISNLLFAAKVTEFKLSQPTNAYCAIVETLAGIRIEVMPV